MFYPWNVVNFFSKLDKLDSCSFGDGLFQLMFESHVVGTRKSGGLYRWNLNECVAFKLNRMKHVMSS